MEKQIKKAIEKYQCSGCANGGNISCFSTYSSGIGCGKHYAGTMISNIGSIFLGMPKGFNRLGINNDLKPNIFQKFEDCDWKYNQWNVPVWKYLNPERHTMVRGFIPRLNGSFIHIFLENCMDKINCLEMTEEDIDKMD